MQAVKLDKAFDNAEWLSDEEEIKALEGKNRPELPGYHVLVRPVSIRERTKGGIIIPDKTKDDISYLTTIGKVIKTGDLAYIDKEKFPLGAWCKENDYVCYGKHSGQKFVYKGVKLLLLFDDQIIMKVENPKDLDPTYNLSN